MRVLCDGRLSTAIALIKRRRNTLPPRITADDQLSLPSIDCNCRLLALLRPAKDSNSCLSAWSLSAGNLTCISTELISTPKKTSDWQGSTTFFQFTWNPNCRKSWIRIRIVSAHLSSELSQIKKSSKYETILCRPLRDMIRRTACVRRWNMPGAARAPNGNLVS